MKNASGLFNLTRNLGGAVGLAALTTILNDRTDLHLARLHEAITWSRAAGAGDAQQPDRSASPPTAATPSRWRSSSSTQIVHRQGVVMAFADVFLVLTVLFVALAAFAVVMKKPPQACMALDRQSA